MSSLRLKKLMERSSRNIRWYLVLQYCFLSLALQLFQRLNGVVNVIPDELNLLDKDTINWYIIVVLVGVMVLSYFFLNFSFFFKLLIIWMFYRHQPQSLFLKYSLLSIAHRIPYYRPQWNRNAALLIVLVLFTTFFRPWNDDKSDGIFDHLEYYIPFLIFNFFSETIITSVSREHELRYVKQGREKKKRGNNQKIRFIRLFSHTVKNLFSCIVPLMDQVRKDIKKNPKKKRDEKFDLAEVNMNSTFRQVNNFLHYQKEEATFLWKKEKVEANKMVTQIKNVLEKEVKMKYKEIEMVVKVEKMPKLCLGDEKLILHLIQNLVFGSIEKFTPRKLVLTIRYSGKGDLVVHCVSNEIKETEEAKILDVESKDMVFFVTQSIASQMGGQVKIWERPDRDGQGGMGFSINLPFPNTLEEEEDFDSDGSIDHDLKILIVEDNIIILRLLEKYANESSHRNGHSHEIVALRDGDLAYEHVKKNLFSPDLIFTDYNMPQMNGDELVIRLRNDGIISSKTPCYLFTGASFQNERKFLLDTGFREIKSKPIYYQDVDHRIKKTIDERILWVKRERRRLTRELEGGYSEEIIQSTEIFNENRILKKPSMKSKSSKSKKKSNKKSDRSSKEFETELLTLPLLILSFSYSISCLFLFNYFPNFFELMNTFFLAYFVDIFTNGIFMRDLFYALFSRPPTSKLEKFVVSKIVIFWVVFGISYTFQFPYIQILYILGFDQISRLFETSWKKSFLCCVCLLFLIICARLIVPSSSTSSFSEMICIVDFFIVFQMTYKTLERADRKKKRREEFYESMEYLGGIEKELEEIIISSSESIGNQFDSFFLAIQEVYEDFKSHSSSEIDISQFHLLLQHLNTLKKDKMNLKIACSSYNYLRHRKENIEQRFHFSGHKSHSTEEEEERSISLFDLLDSIIRPLVLPYDEKELSSKKKKKKKRFFEKKTFDFDVSVDRKLRKNYSYRFCVDCLSLLVTNILENAFQNSENEGAIKIRCYLAPYSGILQQKMQKMKDESDDESVELRDETETEKYEEVEEEGEDEKEKKKETGRKMLIFKVEDFGGGMKEEDAVDYNGHLDPHEAKLCGENNNSAEEQSREGKELNNERILPFHVIDERRVKEGEETGNPRLGIGFLCCEQVLSGECIEKDCEENYSSLNALSLPCVTSEKHFCLERKISIFVKENSEGCIVTLECEV